MHVLEAMLFSVAQRFERQLRNLGPVVDDLLLNLTEQTSESVLRRLLPIKNSLTDFEFNVKEVRSEIVELLASNDNIASLCQPILDAKVWPQDMELVATYCSCRASPSRSPACVASSFRPRKNRLDESSCSSRRLR